MVLAMHIDGATPQDIREKTGCTRGAMERYIADFAVGSAEENFDGYFGIDLGPQELARLQGLWHTKFGKP
jgi:hypothetical protein